MRAIERAVKMKRAMSRACELARWTSARSLAHRSDGRGAPAWGARHRASGAAATMARAMADLDEEHRVEHDLLGAMHIPAGALYGIATARALENYSTTGVRLREFPEFIRALALTKKACAIANAEIGLLNEDVFRAIETACDRLIDSDEHHRHFAVEVVQGGAGTSTNMNANEVIANLAALELGLPVGVYDVVNPNDHVNLCQSTNDAYPSAAKLAVVLKHGGVVEELRLTIDSLRKKGDEFKDIIKMGRTQLQDAVPMTLGQEFHSFAATLEADLTFLERNVDQMYEVNLGGTAIGTSICADVSFAERAVSALSSLTNLPMRSPHDFIEASSSTSSFLLFSNILRRVAVKISKICNDLRLLSSGPRCGFNEINLPAVAPGSSIMPGKINPVIPEVMNQVCFQIMGTDASIAHASEAAQLQLNVFEPVIIYNLLNNMEMMERGLRTLREKCIDGITANPKVCKTSVENSIGIVTALLPLIGYKRSSAVAKEALETGRPVAEIAARYADIEKIRELLHPASMTQARKMNVNLEPRGVCLDSPPVQPEQQEAEVGC